MEKELKQLLGHFNDARLKEASSVIVQVVDQMIEERQKSRKKVEENELQQKEMHQKEQQRLETALEDGSLFNNLNTHDKWRKIILNYYDPYNELPEVVKQTAVESMNVEEFAEKLSPINRGHAHHAAVAALHNMNTDPFDDVHEASKQLVFYLRSFIATNGIDYPMYLE